MHGIDVQWLRREAKRLRKSVLRGEPAALARVAAHVRDAGDFPHARALDVIAREHGHASWPRLKAAVEGAALTREARERRLLNALFLGARATIEACSDDPSLADSFALALARYDLAAVTARLAADPAAAVASVVGSIPPLACVAFSRWHRFAPSDGVAESLAVARALLAAGADPNAFLLPVSDPDAPLSATYGAIIGGNLALARLLLGAGANPNDGESLYHAVEGGDAEAVEMLIAFGATARGTNALLRAIDRHDLPLVARLLAHDADPNEGAGEGQDGFLKGTRPALHHAAVRNAPQEIAAALLAAGADPHRTWEGRDAFAFARVHGAAGVVAALRAAGFAHPLSPADEALAGWHDPARAGAAPDAIAGAGADRGAVVRPDAAAGSAADVDPVGATGTAQAERWFLHRMAARVDGAVALRRALEAGCDPNATQDDGMTALHTAAWEGYAAQVAVLLAAPHDLTHRNAYGGDALGTLVHGAAYAVGPGRDHVACAEALLAAGAVVTPELLDEVTDEALYAVLVEALPSD